MPWFVPEIRVALFAGVCLAVGLAETPPLCNGVDVTEWTAPEWRSPGYHVMCVGDPCAGGSGTEEGECDANADVSIDAHWDGFRQETKFDIKRPQTLLEAEEMVIERHMLSNKDRYRRLKGAISKKNDFKGIFGFFAVRSGDVVPVRIKSAGDFHGLVLAFEGGQFLWPGIEHGFSRNITLPPTKDAPELGLNILTRSLDPLVVEISSFLSQDQAKHIIDEASPHIAKSHVSHMDHDVGKADAEWRTSSQHFLHSNTDMLKRIDRQVSALTNVKLSHQEYFQVLRYNEGERYVAHHDYFDPNMYATNEQIQGMTKKGLFNRMATVFFYLTTVEEGGQTNFPRAGGLPQPRDFGDCSKGISVNPEEGRIIIFYSVKPDASFDEDSLHGGCKVIKGEKWSANKWIWNKPMGFFKD